MQSFRETCLFIFIILFISVLGVNCYKVPPPTIVINKPRGFSVSIPDEAGVTLFAFHGNINVDFETGREAGMIAVDIREKENNRWTYTNEEHKLKDGDTIYYWLYVIKNGLGYEKLFQKYVVGSSPPAVVDRVDTHTPVPPSKPVTQSPPSSPQCGKSLTRVNENEKCANEVIFDSKFNEGLNGKFEHLVQIGNDESEFVVFDSLPENAFIQNNKLIIKPTIRTGEEIHQSVYLGNRCTAGEGYKPGLCEKVPYSYNIVPPIKSARLISKNKFSFKYGKVEVKAKLPHGDWVVPEIWLLQKTLRKEPGKIVLACSFGNDNLNEPDLDKNNKYLFSRLEVGDKKRIHDQRLNNGLWSDNFHTFRMEWHPDYITFFVDGTEYSKGDTKPLLNENGQSGFNDEYYIVLGVHVGGTKDFSDNAMNGGKKIPWNSNDEVKRLFKFYQKKNEWSSTWDDRTQLQIEYVKVWAL